MRGKKVNLANPYKVQAVAVTNIGKEAKVTVDLTDF
jgi:hypothetical protein